MNFNFTAPINVTTSYGIVARHYIKELDKLGADFFLYPQNQQMQTYHEDNALFQKYMDVARYSPKNPSVKLWHEHSLLEHIGAPRIGYPIFELNQFNKNTISSLNSQDKIFVCSNWARDVINNLCQNIPVSVVPLGTDPSVYYPRPRVRTNNLYKFATIGKIEVRKGHQFLAQVFADTFKDVDDVQLNMMWHNQFLNNDETRQWETYYRSLLGHKVTFHPFVPTPNDVANFIASMDCMVFPSLAEGFGLPINDSICMNKPVITTDYSAMSDYAKDRAFLVSIDTLERANDGKWFHGDGEWAHYGAPQKKQLSEYMRYCYENRLTERGDPKDTINHAQLWSWKNSAQKLLEAIS
jgi:glycosyltransferase involved in cell wall biosynthesis